MKKAIKQKNIGPPHPTDRQAFERWLAKQPKSWSLAIGTRLALRVLPRAARSRNNFENVILQTFRAVAIARYAAKYPTRSFDAAAQSAFGRAFGSGHPAVNAGAASETAAFSAYLALAESGGAVVVASAIASAERASVPNVVFDAVLDDANLLHSGQLTPEQLAASALWFPGRAGEAGKAWSLCAQKLRALNEKWWVWIEWYEQYALHEPHRGRTENEDAAFTDIAGALPWSDGADAVNTQIARRLLQLSQEAELAAIPDQSPAPVRVEERDGRVSKVFDSNSPVNATERDFLAWRDPVLDHIAELLASEFARGTNHSRIRDRLTSLIDLLPGNVEDVKEQQFRIGYEIERFEGLMAAYKADSEDMPQLSAPQLEDLVRLNVALKIGISKLERWFEFRRAATENSTSEGDADRSVVADALDQMASTMERSPEYFDRQLPETLRFLVEAVRDPFGATRAVVYGAVRSAENIVSFLGQRALGIAKKGAESLETHISKAIATALVAGLSTAALQISGALPQGWGWLRSLLAAIGVP